VRSALYFNDAQAPKTFRRDQRTRDSTPEPDCSTNRTQRQELQPPRYVETGVLAAIESRPERRSIVAANSRRIQILPPKASKSPSANPRDLTSADRTKRVPSDSCRYSCHLTSKTV
jgi:hypothetical protein